MFTALDWLKRTAVNEKQKVKREAMGCPSAANFEYEVTEQAEEVVYKKSKKESLDCEYEAAENEFPCLLEMHLPKKKASAKARGRRPVQGPGGEGQELW